MYASDNAVIIGGSNNLNRSNSDTNVIIGGSNTTFDFVSDTILIGGSSIVQQSTSDHLVFIASENFNSNGQNYNAYIGVNGTGRTFTAGAAGAYKTYIDDLTVSGSLSASFFSGNGSGLTNLPASVSASYALSASHALASNTATSASYALNATSASYALNATSASYALNATSASYALSSSFAINATSASSALTASYLSNWDINQNAVFSGSVRGEVGALSISSNTASLDCSTGNFFTVTLVSGSNTHVNPSNILPGQTINVRVKQASVASGSISFAPSVKQVSGSAYVPTSTANAEDVVTFISFNATNLYLSNVKNFV